MEWYHYFALGCLAICLVSCLFHVFRLVKSGAPADYAPPSGKVAPAVLYSFTGALYPVKKESAYLHLPTYTAGLFYHLGTLLSIVLFFFLLSGLIIPVTIIHILFILLLVSFISGTGILIKRLVKRGLRILSSPDDYLSNIFVTLFQAMTGLTLIVSQLHPAYFVVAGILFIYIPLGKLKHAIYFFAARYHLGYFYGWRNVWPPKQA